MIDFDPMRPERIAAHYGRMFPNAWRQIDAFRRDKGAPGFADWPAWCFCPLAGAYAIISEGTVIDPAQAGLVSVIGGLAAWRPTKGIYHFDEDIAREVIATPLTGKIPVETLFRLPAWALYIPVQGLGLEIFGSPLYGFFAFLEHDANCGRAELRFLFDRGPESGYELQPFGLHLDNPTLEQAVGAFTEEGVRQTGKAGLLDRIGAKDRLAQELSSQFTPLVNLVLYLCAGNADLAVEGRSEHPELPRPKKTKKGARLFPAKTPKIWQAGWRVGSAIRKARQQARSEGQKDESVNGRRSPIPHVRDSHWHLFWTGKGARKDPSKAIPDVRWMPPIPVGVKDLDDLETTIHPVKK